MPASISDSFKSKFRVTKKPKNRFDPQGGSLRIGGGSGILITNLGGRIDLNHYEIRFRNWWKSLPFGFRYNPRDGARPLFFFLPISPENIQVRTPFATNIVSTMYGTVEEHSEVRYHDIVISGTTGITPRYSQIFKGEPIQHRQRASYDNLSTLPPTEGFFERTRELANNVIKEAEGVSAQFKGAKTIDTGVQQALSGHAAFHNFFRFLLEYKRDTSGEANTAQRRVHPLQFLNYKDNIQYDASIVDFNLTRSASDPFLYRYNIVMRCYNLKTIENEGLVAGLTQRYEQLGLDGLQTSSVFNKMSNGVRGAKNAIGGLLSGGFGG